MPVNQRNQLRRKGSRRSGNRQCNRLQCRSPYGRKRVSGDSPQAMASKIEFWSVDRLTPYDKNARTHDDAQIKQIAASINEFGFLNPILVDEKDGILAGHGRLLAAKDLGMQTVPVVVLTHLTLDQKRAYVIADNQIALNAGWDLELLQQEITALSLADFDVSLTGLEDWRIANLLGSDDEDDEAPGDFDEASEDIATDHECPSCGCKWSGKGKGGSEDG